jgi:riboflavin synthase
MFTGLVQALAPILALEARGSGARLVVGTDWKVERGESIAVSGVCLTAVEVGAGRVTFDLSSETLERTWFARARPGRRVNLERALCLSDRLGGHMVSGHVDGLGTLVDSKDPGDGGRFLAFEAPADLERYLVDKGSIAVDGVSLTVVLPRAARFGVAVIPETLARTSLGLAQRGERVHLEADAIGKWVERLSQPWLRTR